MDCCLYHNFVVVTDLIATPFLVKRRIQFLGDAGKGFMEICTVLIWKSWISSCNGLVVTGRECDLN